jgi:hypothetical membrane protein
MSRTDAARPRGGFLRIQSGRCLRWGARCGIAGPLLFTAAWLVSSLRQTGHSATEIQLSGLAAMDAHDPQIMMAGFAALGAGSIVFGAALRQLPAARKAGPRLVVAAGVAAVAAGLLRRDHMLLVGPGFAGESWHNQAHDIVSAVAYAAMIAAPVMLARSFRADPRLAALRPPLFALAALSAITLMLFASRALEPWNPVVQRIAVTLPLAAEVLAAARMLALARATGPARARR